MIMEDTGLKEKYGNRKPFSVPENYFETFSAQWENPAPSAKQPANKSFSIRTWIYAAAVAIGVLAVGQVTYTALRQQNTDNSYDDYELYLYSQVDRSALYDYYISEE